jgi:hypothetical protein
MTTTRVKTAKLSSADKARIAEALEFYVDRCNWEREPDELRAYQRLAEQVYTASSVRLAGGRS